MRLFIAIPLPHALQQQLDQWWSLESGAFSDWRTMPQVNRHLTLHFLGEINGNRIDALNDILDELFAETPSMTLSINGMGFFPSPSRARVFWVGVKEEYGVLASCARRCRHLCQPIQGRGEKSSPFRAHITMARHAGKVNGVELVQHFAQPPEFSWKTEEVHLIQSQLHPHGATYQVVERFSFAD